MSININNKIKQFFSGGWGEKLPYKIPEDFGNEEPKTISKKKKKKKKPFVWRGDICPFCKEELEDDKEKQTTSWSRLFSPKKDFCKCGAKKVDDCPACHRETWFKDSIYKHQKYGCGFEGKRLVR